MVELLADANAGLQIAIAESLGSMGSAASTALQEIEKGFASDQPATRIASLAAFISIENDSKRKVDALSRTLDDPDLGVRLVAIEKLGDMGRAGEPAAEKLYELTGRDEERGMALEVLAGMRIRSVPLLVRALTNTDPYVRQYAAERLGELRADARDALPNLKDLQNDESDLVKRAARNAVREIERDNK
jgi:HEAT repeat protein